MAGKMQIVEQLKLAIGDEGETVDRIGVIDASDRFLQDGLVGNRSITDVWSLIRKTSAAYPLLLNDVVETLMVECKDAPFNKHELQQKWVAQVIYTGKLGAFVKKVPLQPHIKSAYQANAPILDPEVVAAWSQLMDSLQNCTAFSSASAESAGTADSSEEADCGPSGQDAAGVLQVVGAGGPPAPDSVVRVELEVICSDSKSDATIFVRLILRLIPSTSAQPPPLTANGPLTCQTHSTAPRSATPHSTAPSSTAGHGTAPRNTVAHSTAAHIAAPNSSAGHSTAPHSRVTHSTADHSTAGHSTAGHITATHSSAGHSTAGHSTAGHSKVPDCAVPHSAGRHTPSSPTASPQAADAPPPSRSASSSEQAAQQQTASDQNLRQPSHSADQPAEGCASNSLEEVVSPSCPAITSAGTSSLGSGLKANIAPVLSHPVVSWGLGLFQRVVSQRSSSSTTEAEAKTGGHVGGDLASSTSPTKAGDNNADVGWQHPACNAEGSTPAAATTPPAAGAANNAASFQRKASNAETSTSCEVHSQKRGQQGILDSKSLERPQETGHRQQQGGDIHQGTDKDCDFDQKHSKQQGDEHDKGQDEQQEMQQEWETRQGDKRRGNNDGNGHDGGQRLEQRIREEHKARENEQGREEGEDPVMGEGQGSGCKQVSGRREDDEALRGRTPAEVKDAPKGSADTATGVGTEDKDEPEQRPNTNLAKAKDKAVHSPTAKDVKGEDGPEQSSDVKDSKGKSIDTSNPSLALASSITPPTAAPTAANGWLGALFRRTQQGVKKPQQPQPSSAGANASTAQERHEHSSEGARELLAGSEKRGAVLGKAGQGEEQGRGTEEAGTGEGLQPPGASASPLVSRSSGSVTQQVREALASHISNLTRRSVDTPAEPSLVRLTVRLLEPNEDQERIQADSREAIDGRETDTGRGNIVGRDTRTGTASSTGESTRGDVRLVKVSISVVEDGGGNNSNSSSRLEEQVRAWSQVAAQAAVGAAGVIAQQAAHKAPILWQYIWEHAEQHLLVVPPTALHKDGMGDKAATDFVPLEDTLEYKEGVREASVLLEQLLAVMNEVVDEGGSGKTVLGDECAALIKLCQVVEQILHHGLRHEYPWSQHWIRSQPLLSWIPTPRPQPFSMLCGLQKGRQGHSTPAKDAKDETSASGPMTSVPVELGVEAIQSMRMAAGVGDAAKLQLWVRVSLNEQRLGSRMQRLANYAHQKGAWACRRGPAAAAGNGGGAAPDETDVHPLADSEGSVQGDGTSQDESERHGGWPLNTWYHPWALLRQEAAIMQAAARLVQMDDIRALLAVDVMSVKPPPIKAGGDEAAAVSGSHFDWPLSPSSTFSEPDMAVPVAPHYRPPSFSRSSVRSQPRVVEIHTVPGGREAAAFSPRSSGGVLSPVSSTEFNVQSLDAFDQLLADLDAAATGRQEAAILREEEGSVRSGLKLPSLELLSFLQPNLTPRMREAVLTQPSPRAQGRRSEGGAYASSQSSLPREDSSTGPPSNRSRRSADRPPLAPSAPAGTAATGGTQPVRTAAPDTVGAATTLSGALFAGPTSSDVHPPAGRPPSSAYNHALASLQGELNMEGVALVPQVLEWHPVAEDEPNPLQADSADSAPASEVSEEEDKNEMSDVEQNAGPDEGAARGAGTDAEGEECGPDLQASAAQEPPPPSTPSPRQPSTPFLITPTTGDPPTRHQNTQHTSIDPKPAIPEATPDASVAHPPALQQPTAMHGAAEPSATSHETVTRPVDSHIAVRPHSNEAAARLPIDRTGAPLTSSPATTQPVHDHAGPRPVTSWSGPSPVPAPSVSSQRLAALAVVASHTLQESKGGEFTVYVVEVGLEDGTSYQIQHRFSDFVNLRHSLKHSVSTPLPDSWSDISKARHVTGRARISSEVVRARQAMLDRCLRDVLYAPPSLLQSRVLLQFLAPQSSSALHHTTPATGPDGAGTGAPASKKAVPDDGRSTIRLRFDTGAPRATADLVKLQQGKCATCHAPLPVAEESYSLWGKGSSRGPLLCHYTHMLYCHNCHQNHMHSIPARILHKWDFSRHPVCVAVHEFLKAIFSQPMISVTTVNPGLYARVPTMAKAYEQRQRIVKALQLARAAGPENAAKAQRLLDAAGHRAYLLERADFWSLKDLLEISKGAFSELPNWLEMAAQRASAIATASVLSSRTGEA